MARAAMLIILMMLAHATFMASQVSTHDQQASRLHQAAVTASSLALDEFALDFHCFTVQAVDRSTPLPLLEYRSLPPVPSLAPAGASRVRVAIIPPQRPPAVYRALLQVYRE